MGIQWSDVLYPDNPNRRDEVNKLAQSIRTSFISIYTNVRSVSLSLNQAYNKFQMLDALDLNITFQQNLDKITAAMEQWKATTKKLRMDPNIPDHVKNLMGKFEKATSVGKFPDTVKDIVSDSSLADGVSSGVVGLIAGTVAVYFIEGELEAVITSIRTIAVTSGILGGMVGMAAGLLTSIIVGAIEGAMERDNLEDLKAKYSAMDKNLRGHLNELEQGVASVQRAIIKALPDNVDDE